MAVRDRVVLCTVAVGACASLVGWQVLGRWPALVLLILAIAAASIAYRIEPPRIDLGELPRRLPDVLEGPDPQVGGRGAALAEGEPIDQ